MWRRIEARELGHVLRFILLLPASGTTFSARGCGAGWIARVEDFLFRPELLLAALGHDQNVVDAGDGARPMRDHHDDAAARAHAEDGAGQRLVAFRVEVGIGLVEHDQERIAIERARQRDALRLAGRQRAAMVADLGLVAVAAD